MDWQGRIWVGTIGVASMVDPAAEEADRIGKPLLLRALLPARGVLPAADLQRWPWCRAHLVFDYARLPHFRENDTPSRTQLHPVDGEPSPRRADFRRVVGPLATGKYTFRGWRRDWAGNVTGPQEITLQAVPPPWRSWGAVVR